MLRALLWKEVRACWIPGLLAFLGQSWIALGIAVDFENPIFREFDFFDSRRRPGHSPIDLDVWGAIGFLALGLGATLAAIQTIAESVQGTAPFLVHVARSRPRILAAKIAGAAIVYVLATLPPLIAGFASVIDEPPPAAPLTWTHARFAWVLTAAGFATYLAVLAAGIRGFRLHFRQAAETVLGLGALAALLALGVALPWITPAVILVTVAIGFAGAWAFAGFSAREF